MAKKKRATSNSKKSTVELHKLAHYTFFVGLLVAIVAGLFRNLLGPEVLVTTLVILGTVVGLFNLTVQETQPFLLAAVALMLAYQLCKLRILPSYTAKLFSSLFFSLFLVKVSVTTI